MIKKTKEQFKHLNSLINLNMNFGFLKLDLTSSNCHG